MSAVDILTPARARSQALQAGLALLFTIIIAIIGINFVNNTISFILSPLIVVYLWPRGADLDISHLILFFTGLFFDLLSGGNVGVWPIIFLLGFALVRPNQRAKDVPLFESWLNFSLWMAILVVVVLVLDFLGRQQVSSWALFFGGLGNILIFPLFHYCKKIARAYLVGDDD